MSARAARLTSRLGDTGHGPRIAAEFDRAEEPRSIVISGLPAARTIALTPDDAIGVVRTLLAALTEAAQAASEAS